MLCKSLSKLSFYHLNLPYYVPESKEKNRNRGLVCPKCEFSLKKPTTFYFMRYASNAYLL